MDNHTWAIIAAVVCAFVGGIAGGWFNGWMMARYRRKLDEFRRGGKRMKESTSETTNLR